MTERKKNIRIVFMGTPEFAVPSLKILIDNGFNIVGVLTAPDKPSGRGRAIRMSAVKQYALKEGLNVLQPTNLKSPDFIKILKELNPDLQIVVAFRMLPEIVWSYPALGTFNLHASLLPQYRGAAPINHVIINGESRTGLTSFLLKKEIDTGDIIFQEETEIGVNETAGDLHDRLMEMGAHLVLKTVHAVVKNRLQTRSQISTEKLKPAPKIFKKDCIINWDQSADQVYNFIRGLSPYPAAYSFLVSPDGKKIQMKIFSVEKSEKKIDFGNTNLFTDSKTFINIACRGNFVSIKELQIEGKRKMTVQDFLRGFNLNNNWKVQSF